MATPSAPLPKATVAEPRADQPQGSTALVTSSTAPTPSAETVVSVYVPSNPATMAFRPLDPSPYPGQVARRAELPDPQGAYQIFIDELEPEPNTGNPTGAHPVYHCKIVKKESNKTLVDQGFPDPDPETLLSDSHVFTAKIAVNQAQDNASAAAAPTPVIKTPVVVLTFQMVGLPKRYKIKVLCPYADREALNAVAERYEFKKTEGDPNEEVVTYDRIGIPTNWRLNGEMVAPDTASPVVVEPSPTGPGPHLARKAKKARRPYYYFPTQFANLVGSVDSKEILYDLYYQPLPVDDSATAQVQQQLEDKLANPGLPPIDQYFIHIELSKIYDDRANKNPAPLNAFGKMARDHRMAATALQPQFPLLNMNPTLRLAPFKYMGQANEVGAINGIYGYKIYSVNEAGHAKAESNAVFDEVDLQVELNKNGLNNNSNNNGFLNNNYSNGNGSPTGLFKVDLHQDRTSYYNNGGTIVLAVTNVNDGTQSQVTVPDSGNAEVLGWNPRKDYYYFLVIQPHNGFDLWQLDPASSKAEKIGVSNRDVRVSPDGRWILWGNGGGANYGTQPTSGFNAFSAEKKASYRVTKTLEPKYFLSWEPQAAEP
jgi:hypothetical protein